MVAPMDHASFLSDATLIEIGVYINIFPFTPIDIYLLHALTVNC